MAFEIVCCKNCKKRNTPYCEFLNYSKIVDDDFCSNGESIDGIIGDYVYTTKEMDKHIKVNICLMNKFREQLTAEYGKEFTDIWNMYETLYQEQMNDMLLPWYEYGFDSADKNGG